MRIIKQDLWVFVYNIKFNILDWRKNRVRHREDGPAEIWRDGEKFYHLEGRHYLEDNYWKEIHENY